MPFGATSAMPSGEGGPIHTTHALLLGFKNSHLTPQITNLQDVMSNKLGWKTSLYWIDGPDSKIAQQRLDNISYSLLSNLQHPDERIIIYYGGNVSKTLDVLSIWDTDCDLTWHASPKQGNGTNVCADCDLHVDPSMLLRTVLRHACDILLLMDGRADLCQPALEQWMRTTAFRPEYRRRNVHVVTLEGFPKELEDGDREERCVGCGSPALLCFDREEMHGTPEFTTELAEALVSAVTAATTDSGDANSKQHGASGASSPVQSTSKLAGKFEMTAVLEYRPFTLPRSKPPIQPTSSSFQRHDAVNVLLFRWDHGPDVWNTGEEAFCTSLMQEAFENLNYNVEIAYVPDDADSEGPWPGHNGWIGNTLHRFVKDHGRAGNLLVVYYIGHAGVDHSSEHLEGWRTTRAGPHFDITRMQALLRDRCAADVLLILDCCHAGYVPDYFDLAYRHSASRPPHTMETLAACPSESTTLAVPPQNFSRRLAGQLILHAGQEPAMSVDELHSLLVHDPRYRDSSSGRENESKEPVRLLNCGKGSITLGRMPDKPGAEPEKRTAQVATQKYVEKPADDSGEKREEKPEDQVLGLDERSLGDRRLDVQRELCYRPGM